MSKFKDFFQSKSKTAKFFSFFFTGFLFAGALGATAGTSYLACDNYKKGTEFDKSYNIRFELDLEGDENPNTPEVIHTIDEITKNVDDAVTSYTKYLDQKGIQVSDIYPEIYQTDKTDDPYKVYINAVVPNVVVANPHKITDDDPARVDEQKTEIYFNSIYSPRLSVFYNDGTSNGTKEYIFTKDDLVGTNNKRITMPESEYENAFYLHLQDQLDSTNISFKNIKETFKDSTSSGDNSKNDDPTNAQPYMYIINDQQGFFNRLNYIIEVCKNKDKGGWSHIYKNWLSSSEQSFGDDYLKAYEDDPKILQSANPILQSVDALRKDGNSSTNDDQTLEFGSIFEDRLGKDKKIYNFIEDVEAVSQGSFIKHTGKLKYSFMSKWIIGIVTNDSSGESNYLKYFPDKDPNKSSKNSDDMWMVVTSPASSRFDTKLLQEGFTNNSFAYPVKNIIDSLGSDYWSNDLTGLDRNGGVYEGKTVSINEVDQSISGSVLGNSAISSMLVAILAIILIVGIIVSLLYKIPGMIAFSFMLLTTAITGMAMILGGFQISVAFLIGMMAIVLLGTFTCINYFERLKKQVAQTYDMQVSCKRGFLSSVLSCLDLHIILILIGVALIYFSTSIFVTTGVCFIIGSLLSLVINYFLLSGTMFILFGNQSVCKFFDLFVWNRKKLISRFEKKSAEVKNLNKLTFFGETPVAKKEGNKFLNFFNNGLAKTQIFGWRAIVYSVICVAIAVVGLVILFTVGVHNSYTFYGGTRLMIYVGNDPSKAAEIINFLNLNTGAVWHNALYSDNYVYVVTSQTFTYDYFKDMADDLPFGINNLMVSSISADPITNALTKNINLLLIAAGFITAYSLIRLGWTAVIPIFVGIVAGPLLTISLISLCQIYFDTYILYASVMVFIINTFFVFNLMSNVNNSWMRQRSFSYKEIKQTINLQINNHMVYYLVLFGTVLLILISTMIFAPKPLIVFAYLSIIGLIVSVFVSRTFAPMISAFFLAIRNKYLKNISTRSLMTKNYDTLDEELIKGVNLVEKEKTYL